MKPDYLYKTLRTLHSLIPYEFGQKIFENSSNGANGVLEIKCDGWYYVKMAGGGGSANAAQHQNSGAGSSGAGFLGEIFLTKGLWNWKVGRAGAANQMASGELSSLLKADNPNMGIIAGAGWCRGHYPQPDTPGGILERKNIRTRKVVVASNGNIGYAGGYGTWQGTIAESVLKPSINENWGRGSVSSGSPVQGVLFIKFMGL